MSVRSHRAVRLGVSAALMTSFSANAHVRTASRAKPTLRLSGKYWPAIVSLDPYFSLIWPAKMGQNSPPMTWRWLRKVTELTCASPDSFGKQINTLRLQE